MPKFIVYEVQEETRTRMWCYQVEADDADQALELVQTNGDERTPEPVDMGTTGDSDFGASGYAVRAVDGAKADMPKFIVDDPWEEALNDMTGNLT